MRPIDKPASRAFLTLLHNFSLCDIFRIMKSVSPQRRTIRVTPAVHRAVKTAAASESKTLEELASEVLTEALEQRRKLAGDDILRATLSRPMPSQTRG